MAELTGNLRTGADTYSSAITEAFNYQNWLVDQFRPHLRGRILELGIGHGAYCQILRAYGDYLGLDHDAQSVEGARLQFPGMAFERCDILDAAALRAVAPQGADAVVSLNVFEHIEDDVRAIGNVVDVIRPGGHLCLLVPAMTALYNELDRLAGHVRRYSVERMRTILAQQPVEIVRAEYMNPVGAIGWWANSLWRPNSLDAPAINRQIRVFDRYVIPVSKALTPLFRSFFGQSLICIARRR